MSDQEYYTGIFILVFSVFIALTVFINGVLLKFVKTLGIREQSTTIIRWSPVSKPSLGGITFFLIFLLSISSFSFFFPGNIIFHDNHSLALIIICILGFLLGLGDDAYNTNPLLKLFVQTLCGVVLWLCGAGIKITPYEWLNITLTIIWVIGVMNSINMLDNMDGITASVSASIILSFILIQIVSDKIHLFDMFVLCAVLASVIGFLFHNWNPSRMFMGDTGSQFLGVFLAYYGIRYFWNGTDIQSSLIQSKQITLVLIGFMIPILDSSIVIINRLLRGQSPAVGGKDHTTHHLSYLGYSDSQVGFIFLGLSAFSTLLILVMVRLIDGWSHLYTIAFWCWFFVVFCVLFIITRKNKNYVSQGTQGQ